MNIYNLRTSTGPGASFYQFADMDPVLGYYPDLPRVHIRLYSKYLDSATWRLAL